MKLFRFHSVIHSAALGLALTIAAAEPEDEDPLWQTPFMIGDFFGFTGGDVHVSNESLNRFGVFTNNLPQQFFFPPTDPLSVTANFVNGNITLNPNINMGSFGGGVQVVPMVVGGFTSTLSSNEVLNLLQLNSSAIVRIVDANTYNTVATTFAMQQFGPGGGVIFVPSESGALANNPNFGDNILSSGFDVLYVYDYRVQLDVASPSTAGAAVARQKIAENGSVLPRDRVYFDYGFLDSASAFLGGADMHRFMPGFEKTFHDGRASIEMRFPFATTLDGAINTGRMGNAGDVEFGNLTTYLKYLIAGGERDDRFAVSAGLGFAFPTADDVRVFDLMGHELVRVENEAVHLLPFVGGIYTPNDQLFMHGFFQFDFATNGNSVSTQNLATGALEHAGEAYDVNYAYFDGGIGYWLFRNESPEALFNGIAPIFELHYSLPLQETDVIQSRNFRVGNFGDRNEALNAVVGLSAQMKKDLWFNAGYVVPIGGNTRQSTEGAFRVSLNWTFGE